MPSSTRRPRLVLLLALLAPAASARGADATPAASAARPFLPRSSIAAVLAQRGPLQLTPEQVATLEQADARLARDQEAATVAQPHPEDTPIGLQPGKSPASSGPSTGMSGGKTRPIVIRNSGPDPAAQLQQTLDALDTRAFLEVVETLPEPLRERATEVASRYREQLADQRERQNAKSR